LINTAKQKSLLIKEFKDYSQYKEVLGKLQKSQRERTAIDFLKKSLKNTQSEANMA